MVLTTHHLRCCIRLNEELNDSSLDRMSEMSTNTHIARSSRCVAAVLWLPNTRNTEISDTQVALLLFYYDYVVYVKIEEWK